MSVDVDFLIVGAGACGLAAHDAGISAAVVKKLDRPAGNSSLSTGSVLTYGSVRGHAVLLDDGAVGHGGYLKRRLADFRGG